MNEIARLQADRDALAAHIERLREALQTVEHEASLVQDFIWPRIIGDEQHAPDQKEASDAIWRIHGAVRPALAAMPAESLAEHDARVRAEEREACRLCAIAVQRVTTGEGFAAVVSVEAAIRARAEKEAPQ